MALKGELSDIPVKEVFKIISETKGTGILNLSNGVHNLQLQFQNGKIVNASGDKTPTDSLKLAMTMEEGEFEFNKTGSVKPLKDSKDLEKILDDFDKIKSEWEKIKSLIPSEQYVVKLSDESTEQIELSGNEWKIIAMLKGPMPILEIEKQLNIGAFETLKVLSSLIKKKLIELSGEVETEQEVDEKIANLVPVRNLGYWAMRSPIEGIKAIEFYRRIDDKKTLGQIAKEMGISLKEAKEIFDYLLKNDKVEPPKGV